MTGPDTSELEHEFPSRARWRYLNHAAVSPWPTRTRRAIEAFAQANHQDGPDSFLDWLDNERSLRARAARLLGAEEASEISLIPNTSEGICIVAHGLDWRAGDNVVLLADDFPSNQLPWHALAARGVTCRPVDVLEADDPEQALLAAMDERTRVLAVSAVHWSSGLRLKLDPLGRACRSSGILFFVDAIQQFGALRIDVARSQIDCLSAGGHKWQMAPEGLGLLYCRATWRSRLQPLKEGWRMFSRPFDFEAADRSIADGGQRFEPGTPNTLGQFALNASLSLQEDWGTDWIEAQVLAHAGRFYAGLAALPAVKVLSPAAPERRSGIVSFCSERLAARDLVAALGKRRIITAPRGGGVRLSPHAYQESEMVNAVVESIAEILKIT
ncbi:MAG: aminotransferase class V-fold PLP-dependent enzyme [Pseudomonadota bacterium]